MRVEFEINDPSEVEAKITLIASVKDFMLLAQQLETGFPTNLSGPLASLWVAIDGVSKDARKHFYRTEVIADETK